jgi:preprotein translocase subunit SecY
MFNIPELRKKIIFTLGVLVIYRLGNHIPVIGVDIDKLLQMMSQSTGLSGFFSYIDLFSGGNLRQCTIFALGISPYITASIMMQFLGMSIPTLEQLSKEGEYGRRILNQYTRYLTVFVAMVQSTGFVFLLERYGLVIDPGIGSRILFVISITVGTMFVMWLGEQISLFGIGNGSSMIIFAGIVARFPEDIIKVLGGIQEGYLDPMIGILIFVIVLAMAAAIVFLEKGDRKIPVQYSRRVIGNKVYGGQSTYIPFKINPAGVMPVILASAMLNIPMFTLGILAAKWAFFKPMVESLTPGGFAYSILDFVLIIGFSFVYTALVFNPEELADNIKKGGGFIPGIRPGKQTADFFS